MPPLSDEEIARRLQGREGWTREAAALQREFKLRDFVGAVDFVNRMVPIAEEMNHHPDLSISWNRVTVSLSTHSAGGITDSDFALAERIDALAADSD